MSKVQKRAIETKDVANKKEKTSSIQCILFMVPGCPGIKTEDVACVEESRVLSPKGDVMYAFTGKNKNDIAFITRHSLKIPGINFLLPDIQRMYLASLSLIDQKTKKLKETYLIYANDFGNGKYVFKSPKSDQFEVIVQVSESND